MPPQRPGYSIEMHAATLERFEFPGGAAWTEDAAASSKAKPAAAGKAELVA